MSNSLVSYLRKVPIKDLVSFGIDGVTVLSDNDQELFGIVVFDASRGGSLNASYTEVLEMYQKAFSVELEDIPRRLVSPLHPAYGASTFIFLSLYRAILRYRLYHEIEGDPLVC
jgi:hypothetical protein